MSDHTPSGSATRFLGGLLMAVGGLITVTAGLCTLGVTVIALIGIWDQPGEFLNMLTDGLPTLLISGGVPIAVGVGVFYVGRLLYRGPKQPPGSTS